MDFSVSLKRVDRVANEKDCVLLKFGKTVIGRGPILKCADSRVSRNHAILDLDEKDKLLTLTSTHINPCFYKSVDDDTFTTLTKDQKRILANGDKFSLLSSELIYEVVIETNEELSNGNSTNSKDDGKKKRLDVSSSSKQRKRILPDWLKDVEFEDESTSDLTTKTKPATKKPRKQPELPSKRPNKQPALSESSQESSSQNSSRKFDEKSRITKRKVSVDSNSQENGSQREEKSVKTIKKKKCPFGSECYRKNPVHFEEFTHDNDSDDENASDDNDDVDKPECEFGLDCYRKNPQHRKDYKHTKRIRQAVKKATAKARRRNDDDEDNGDDESNDSFVVDDDSDEYKPESDSETEDELQDLLKEAEEFKRNKKLIQPNA